MNFQTIIRAHFERLADAVFSELSDNEELSLHLSAEDQQYIRLNASKVRQATTVRQCHLTVNFQCHSRKLSCSFDLTENPEHDLATLRSFIDRARLETQALPEDPFIVPMQNHGQSNHDHPGQLPLLEDLLACIADATTGTDFTGLYAAGPQIRAVRNSKGLVHWFSTESFFMDYSLFTCNAAGDNKAVKGLYADRVWQPQRFLESIAENKARLSLLQKTSISLTPGEYRVYLAPAAVAELIGMYSWGALGFSAWKNGSCALQALIKGEKCFSEQFNLIENFNLALTPQFNSLGELPPTQLTLIEQGQLRNLLVSSRAAKEYTAVSNAADPTGWFGEYLRSAELLPGKLPERDVLAALNTGLYISNLHYLNWSDVQNARITGMTRYACFWVENGEISAPILDLRFDESLYRIFGSELVAFTRESYLQPSVDTYNQRALGGCKVPGALVGSLRFTL